MPGVRADPNPFTFTAQIRWGDIGRLGHVNNIRIVEYFQEARAAFLTAAGLPTAVAVRAMTVEFLHPLTPDDHRARVTSVVRTTGRSSFTVAQEAHNEAGTLSATAEAVLVALDIHTAASRPLSEAERTFLVMHTQP